MKSKILIFLGLIFVIISVAIFFFFLKPTQSPLSQEREKIGEIVINGNKHSFPNQVCNSGSTVGGKPKNLVDIKFYNADSLRGVSFKVVLPQGDPQPGIYHATGDFFDSISNNLTSNTYTLGSVKGLEIGIQKVSAPRGACTTETSCFPMEGYITIEKDLGIQNGDSWPAQTIYFNCK